MTHFPATHHMLIASKDIRLLGYNYMIILQKLLEYSYTQVDSIASVNHKFLSFKFEI